MNDIEQILKQISSLNLKIDDELTDKRKIDNIEKKIDDMNVQLKEIKTIVEYETINTQKNSVEIKEVKIKQDVIEKEIAEMKEGFSFLKKMNFIFLSSSFGIIAVLIKQVFFK